MGIEMAWSGLLDESFSSFRAMLDEVEGEDGFYNTIDTNGRKVEAVLGSSLMWPDSSVLSNVGSINASHHLSCSMSASAHTSLDGPGVSDLLGLLHRRNGIESRFKKNGVNQKPDGVVGEREADAPHAAANNNNNGYGNVASVTKGRKNGFPAKNLMAERRRRKKLNDRLLMLRSVVPKVSKMDRASILGDAVQYLQELLQRINDINTELMSGSCNSKPLAPTLPEFSFRMNEEYHPKISNLEGEPARVEVRTREGKALHIHMFCSEKPGLLLSTIRALDELGLDVKQAVISCLNGFVLDVLQEKQSRGGDVTAEEIKALLLHTAGYHAGLQ